MKKSKILLPMMAVLLFGMGLAACNNNAQKSGNTPTSSVAPQKETIKITAAGDKKEVEIEQTLQLTASVEGVTWASSDVKIATVDNAGKVTAVAAGDVTITATKDGYNKGTIAIKVKRAPALATLHMEDADHFAADGWWGTADDGYTPVYNKDAASGGTCIAHIDNGDKETIKFSSSAAIKAEVVITMSSSSSDVNLAEVMSVKLNNAAVSMANKTLAGGSTDDFQEVSLGELDIAATNTLEISFLGSAPYLDDLSFYSKQAATIAIIAAPVKEQITVAQAELAAYIDTDSQIEVTKPTSLEGVSFVSDKEEVASVNDAGKVTGHKLGSATITVKKEGWYSARVSVTVDKAGVEGEIRIQAEDAAEIPEGFHEYTDRTTGIQNGHYGGAYITGYDVSSACSLSYTFESPKAQSMTLIIAGASHYQMSEDFVFGTDAVIKLNNAVVTPTGEAKIESNQQMGAPTVEVTIGVVQVKQGTNTFVLEFAERAPALDAFRFIPVQAA